MVRMIAFDIVSGTRNNMRNEVVAKHSMQNDSSKSIINLLYDILDLTLQKIC